MIRFLKLLFFPPIAGVCVECGEWKPVVLVDCNTGQFWCKECRG